MKKGILSIGLIFLFGLNQLFAQNNLFDLMQDEKANYFEVQKLAKKYFDSVGTGKGTGYKIYKRWEYDVSLQIDEKGFRKTTAEIERECQRASVHFRKSNARTAAVTNWTELGPDKITPTSGWNPGVGRLKAIAVSLKTPTLIFAGAETGGVWKSTNGGSTWMPLMHEQNNQNIRSLAIDPQNDNIVYAGTTSGYYKSTDGGTTWVLSTSVPNTISKIIFHPTNSNIILTAGSSGIYKTTNGGTTWVRESTSSVEDIEFKPGDPTVVYSVGSGVYLKSTDSGDSFSTMSSITGSGRSFVAVSAANPAVVYVIQASGSVFGKLFKSTDSGANFTVVSSGSSGNNNLFGYEPDGSGTSGQAWHDLDFDVSPTDANLIQVGAIICFKSTNGGTSWTATTDWTWGNNIGYNHADVHVVKYFGNVLYSGSDGGIFKSTNNGDDWTDLTTGMGIRQFYRFGLCRANPNVMSGGSQDNGTSVRRADGIWYDWLGGDGMESFVDHNSTSILYGTSQNGSLYKSTNGGTSRTSITNPSGGDGNWVTPFRMDPTTNTTLYVGYTNVYKSTNSGSTWTDISTYSASSNCDEIEIAPSNSNYIITRHSQSIYKTTDGGTTWTTITKPTGTVNTIAIHPTKPTHVIMATSSGTVFYSTDFGATFTQVTGASLPAISINKVVFDDGAKDGYYIGNTRGVFYRDNTMTDFLPFTENLPTQSVYDMEYHVATKRIYVATYGRGVWWASAYNAGPVNTNPTVSITAPANNTTLTDPTSVTVSATATDPDANGSIKRVQFYANSTLIGTDSISPYSIAWTTNLKIGTYSLTAVATDNLGGQTTSSVVTLIIKSAINQKPSIDITSPTNNQLLDEPATTNFAVTTSDIDGTVANVKYYLNGALKSTVTATPFGFTANNLAPGTYKLIAAATDNQGATASDSITFVVRKAIQGTGCNVAAWVSTKQYCIGEQTSYNNSLWESKWCVTGEIPGSNQWGAWVNKGSCISTTYTQVPVVTITSPSNNSNFNAPANITITATSTDADGTIAKVEFYNGTTKLGQSTTSPYSFAWNNVQVGTYNITAIATDNSGAIDTSSAVIVNVITLTSVNEALQGNETYIYPNPTSDILYLRSPEMLNKDYDVQVTDSKGNIVFNQNINLLNTYGLDLKPYSNGLYFIKIKNGVNSRTFKFEVKR